MQQAINLVDAERWSDILLERVPGTEFLKLNVVAGGVGGGPFDGIQIISKQDNIPPSQLQLSRLRIGSEPSQLTKFIRMGFQKIDKNDSGPLLWTRSFGYGYGDKIIDPDFLDYDVLDNQITCISGFWGSPLCPPIEQMSITFRNGDRVVHGSTQLDGRLPFNIQAPNGFYISNIYGRSGWSLNQIGVYLKADRPLQWSLQAHSQFPEQFKKQIRTFLQCIQRLYCQGQISGKGSEEILGKIIRNMLLDCGMTVEQYREMASNLVFTQNVFRVKFAEQIISSSQQQQEFWSRTICRKGIFIE